MKTDEFELIQFDYDPLNIMCLSVTPRYDKEILPTCLNLGEVKATIAYSRRIFWLQPICNYSDHFLFFRVTSTILEI